MPELQILLFLSYYENTNRGRGGGGKITPLPPKKLELSSWPTTLGLVLKLINYIAFS